MTVKALLFHHDARMAVLRGVRALADAVAVTLGPRGRNVIFQQADGSVAITKDGVTVADQVELADLFENLGAQLVKEVSRKTAEVAGDGTTTATILARALYEEGLKLVAVGECPLAIRRGIDKAGEAAVQQLTRLSKPVSDPKFLVQVGTVSANGDAEIGTILAKAVAKVGKGGVITIQEGRGLDTTVEVVEGMRFEAGYLSTDFVTDPERLQAVLENPFVLVCARKLSTLSELVPLLEQLAVARASLLLIADDIEADALTGLTLNKVRGTVKVCVVRAPGVADRGKDVLEDIAVSTGARLVADDTGIRFDQMEMSDLGSCTRVVVDKDRTTLIGGAGDRAAVGARVEMLRHQIAGATRDVEREQFEKRLASLAGAVAIIHVGAATEGEVKEKRARVDDALHAVRAALEEGTVPGGGLAYLRCLATLDALELGSEQQSGVNVVKRALVEPAKRIADNAGVEGLVVVGRILENGCALGFNAAAQTFEDLEQAGIIDPTKVARAALQNAASIAGLLLTTEAMIACRSETRRNEHHLGA